MDFLAQPKQEQLLELFKKSKAGWIGYGGARGGGKSAGARMVQIYRRLLHPGTRGLIFRRTYGQLYENHIEPLFRQFPKLREFYTDKHREVRIPVPNGGFSSIVFGYAEHAKDIYSYLGKEYMDICVDQAEQLSEDELLLLKTCNRWPGKGADECKLGLFPNPGGIGHAFLKRVFHDRQYKGNENPEDYAFLQAYGWDNVEWCRPALVEDGFIEDDYYRWAESKRFEYFITRSDYGQRLNRLPESLKIGHLLGRWDIFAGQYFDNFDPTKQVKRPEDPGSETKYEISKRSYPKLNVKNLTFQQAAQIYERDFWEKIHGSKIQDQALANKLFDLAVNMGVGRAIRLLQEASGLCGLPLKEDGVLGTKTLTVINICNSGALLLEFKALASSYYRELAHVHPALQRFLGGWLKRAAA